MQELGLYTVGTPDMDGSQNTGSYAVVCSKGKLVPGLECEGHLPDAVCGRILRPEAGPVPSRIQDASPPQLYV